MAGSVLHDLEPLRLPVGHSCARANEALVLTEGVSRRRLLCSEGRSEGGRDGVWLRGVTCHRTVGSICWCA